MRIKTITCHRAINHGAMLQAFALQTYLLSLGHNVEIIDYCPSQFQKISLWSVPGRYRCIGLGPLYVLLKLPIRLKGRRRAEVFEDFCNKYLRLTNSRYYSVQELRDNPPEADLYIAGSDQIWNTYLANGTDAVYYLDFGPSETKRISYAASFSTVELKAGTENFVKEELNNFDAISVRESSAVTILKKYGYLGTQVVDPVFLLSAAEWSSLLKLDSSIPPEKYIFVYDFMRDGSIEKIAKRLASLLHCKIYCIFKQPYADRCFYYIGPEKFVELIRNSQCVVCDSFHGIAFSLIFQKDFFVVNRTDGLNNRMHDILEKYNLKSRLVGKDAVDSELSKSIDYSKVCQSYDNDILQAKSWLKNNLSL